MASDPRGETLILIYDGACPFCTRYCTITALRAQGVDVALHDARAPGIRERFPAAARHDLDQGMLALWRGEAFHGAQAVNLIGRLVAGSPLSGLMRHRRLASLSYPLLRLARNLALAARRTPRIGGP